MKARQLRRPPKLPQSQLVALTTFTFGCSFVWTALSVVLLPVQLTSIVGEGARVSFLSSLVLFGTIVSALAGPVFGAISDHFLPALHPYGGRKPFIFLGTVLSLLCLFLFSLPFPSLPEAPASSPLPLLGWLLFPQLSCFFLLYLALCSSLMLATTPYCALIPDLVPPDQLAAASAAMGVATMLGSACSSGAGMLLDPANLAPSFHLLAAVLLASAAPTLLVLRTPPRRAATLLEFVEAGQGAPGDEEAEGARVEAVDPDAAEQAAPYALSKFFDGVRGPFQDATFVRLFTLKLFVTSGSALVQNFLQFFIETVVPPPYFLGTVEFSAASTATSLFLLALLLGATLSSVASGVVATVANIPRLLVLSLLVQAAAVSALAAPLLPALRVLVPGLALPALLLIAHVLGAGMGAFECNISALIAHTLPRPAWHAQDFAIWKAAASLPQVVATPLGGLVLTLFQPAEVDGGSSGSGAASPADTPGALHLTRGMHGYLLLMALCAACLLYAARLAHTMPPKQAPPGS